MPEFKGFAGNQKTTNNSTAQNSYFLCGLEAVHGNNLEEAYLCFSELKDSPAALFNLAVCYFMTSLYEKALITINEAEKLLSSKSPMPPKTAAIPDEILQFDAQNNGYRSPMAYDTPNLFPVQAKLRILRLKADIYGELNYAEEFIKLIPLFVGKKYKNIEELKIKFRI